MEACAQGATLMGKIWAQSNQEMIGAIKKCISSFYLRKDTSEGKGSLLQVRWMARISGISTRGS
jgi:hypothetical protein